MDKGAGVKGEDVPLEALVPLHERSVRKSSFKKLRASIQAVGLIEPLCVYLVRGCSTWPGRGGSPGALAGCGVLCGQR